MQRVLFISAGANLGGAEISLLDIIRCLPRDRFEASLLLPTEGPLGRAAREAGAGVTVVRWPGILLRTGRERTIANRILALIAPLLFAPVIARIGRHIRRHGIHIVHTNGTKAHLGGGIAARLAGVPVVWHIRDIQGRGILERLLRMLSRLLPSKVIANSMASSRGFAVKESDPRVRVVYNGIDLDRFRPLVPSPAAKRALGIEQSDFVIGTLGALAPLKGHVHLIRAMPAVLERAGEARLLIVGAEMYRTFGHSGHREFLAKEAERRGVAGRVIFAGQRDDVVELYSLMDVVVLASVRPESFGRTLVEAMACERPVIATDLGGPREIITGPEVGLLVPPADPGAMATALLSLHGDPEARLRMGRMGRSRVAERFTLDRCVAGVCSVYDEILGVSSTSGLA